MRPIFDFITKDEFSRLQQFAIGKKTPFLVIDLAKVEAKYDEISKLMSFAKIYYAVKANPNVEVLKLLDKKGSYFDIASVNELDLLLSLGVSSAKMSFGNTIKKEEDIGYAYSKGIRMFATDSVSDLNKIARKAPSSRVFFRILTDSTGADWPLSRKFGAHLDLVYSLAIEAKSLGLEPYGISFHVGSQQRDIGQWDNAIGKCKYLFDSLKNVGIELKMINLGGGFPSSYVYPTMSTDKYCKEITRFLNEDFVNGLPEIIIEPGRSIAADSGVIVSSVVLISTKSKSVDYEWLYLDIGKFGGLIETIDESIKYPIYSNNTNFESYTRRVIIAGPTCDSMDILYEKEKYSVATDLKDGDKVYILSAGAYTYSYCSICFNGFKPLDVYVLDKF